MSEPRHLTWVEMMIEGSKYACIVLAIGILLLFLFGIIR
jgi:hypothetical protein